MADPTSTPLPAYRTRPEEEPRIYLVERLTEEEMSRLDVAPPTPTPAEIDGLDLAAAANDSAERSVKLVLFVGNSHLSRRMLRTARDLVLRIGEARASLRVVDVADDAAASEVAAHRVTFTPTLVLDASAIRTRLVGAASLRAVAELLPDFAECFEDL